METPLSSRNPDEAELRKIHDFLTGQTVRHLYFLGLDDGQKIRPVGRDDSAEELVRYGEKFGLSHGEKLLLIERRKMLVWWEASGPKILSSPLPRPYLMD